VCSLVRWIDHFERVLYCGPSNDYSVLRTKIDPQHFPVGQAPWRRGEDQSRARQHTTFIRAHEERINPLSPRIFYNKLCRSKQHIERRNPVLVQCTEVLVKGRGKKREKGKRKSKIDTGVEGCGHRSMWREREYRTKEKGGSCMIQRKIRGRY
jgi:hypothetical protein